MKKLKLEVTAEDIRLGVRYSGNKCAAARAVKRVYPPRKFKCFVDGYNVWVYNQKDVVGARTHSDIWPTEVTPIERFANSRALSRFIHKFDLGLALAPQNFQLAEKA